MSKKNDRLPMLQNSSSPDVSASCDCGDGGGTGNPAQKVCFGALRTLSISAYLVSWVANSEMLQGISNGTLCPGGVPYDKPAALTWMSYNFMMLSFLFVYPYAVFRRGWTFSHYMYRWAGRIGLAGAFAACVAISYALLVLNVLFIVGLRHVSVATSNAIFQLQTPFTVGLSVWLLQDGFVMSEAAGVSVSLVGVALIVFPPLFDGNDGADAANDLRSASVGVGATLGSAAIGAVYLTSWRVLSERKDVAPPVGAEGLADALTTLGVIGVANFLLGWPMLPAMHWAGMETFELPPPSHWGILIINALIEYAFDATCAVAIYATSAVVTAATAPLTIPLAMVADGVLYGTPIGSDGWGWVGAAAILVGAVLLEMKPNLCSCKRKPLCRTVKIEETPLLESGADENW
eukprot:CAMPEP_0194311042 /NCGR_PEP_ID=MMETSP0171-20130528/8023_1 /TAXON_ID=218684 /ORGANISM="Corethron pennatum, Strain L29A3" /LENGTH=404 /DNA_ID=CAMNT_0039064983 /DNA_START=94 /DNA_END=1305 /DNA_ORIENTATION=+